MLRSNNESLKGIPKEVRHSLEFLDNLLDEFDDGKGSTPASTLGRMKNDVPADARKSLQILDNILGEFDVNNEELRRSESADNLRVPSNLTEEVNRSIEVLDQVLDEFQKEGGKPAVRRREKPGERHEDIRRSLEVLDSVLAEFDDCLESWDNLADQDIYRQCGVKDSPEKSVKSLSFEDQTQDGSTSHDSGLSLQEQIRVTSPPPVPKRSATTKLSDRNSGLFTFPPTDNHQSLDDSLSSDSAFHDNGLSDSVNNAPSSLDDEVFRRVDDTNCTKCGGHFEIMENKENMDASSSPFSERRKMFEDRIGESSKSNVSPLLQRSFAGSSFKRRTIDKTKEPELESVSHKLGESDSNQQPNFVSKNSPKATKGIPPRVDGYLSLPPASSHHAPNCNCKERIQQLQAKFAETRRLLKANKIRGLDAKPPSFVPPPPQQEVAAAKTHVRREINSPNKKLLPNGRSQSYGSLNVSNGNLNSNSRASPLPDLANSTVPNSSDSSSQKLCGKCSTSEPLPLSETIEDIPKLLPTDALKRPHLGLSYYMEDDLSPGVKEILSPSNSSQLSKNNRVTSMSTFSLSDSSLGYVSSQSDLELSNSPMRVEKVPVTSIKFSTLPEGMDLHSLPSYYGQGVENGHKSDGQPLYRDRNFNHTRDPQLRSSSVSPPPPEPEKPKKKHFRGFSRKDKKDKKKNDDNISVTSYLSLDDGMILKAIDGDTSYRNAADSGREEPGVEKKRWSGLRSLLGRR